MGFPSFLKTLTGISGEAKANIQSDAQRQSLYQQAQDIASSSDYKESLNVLTSYAKDSRLSDQDDASRRYAENINASLDRSQQYRNEASTSLQKAKSFNEAASWSKQNGTSITQNLNQEYTDWLQGQSLNGRGTPMGREGAIEIIANQPEANHMMQQRFLQQRQERLENYFTKQEIHSVEDIKKVFARESAKASPQLGEGLASIKEQARAQEFGDSFGLQPSETSTIKTQEAVRHIVENNLTEGKIQIEQRQQTVDSNREAIKTAIEKERDANILSKPWTGATKAILGSSKKE